MKVQLVNSQTGEVIDLGESTSLFKIGAFSPKVASPLEGRFLDAVRAQRQDFWAHVAFAQATLHHGDPTDAVNADALFAAWEVQHRNCCAQIEARLPVVTQANGDGSYTHTVSLPSYGDKITLAIESVPVAAQDKITERVIKRAAKRVKKNIATIVEAELLGPGFCADPLDAERGFVPSAGPIAQRQRPHAAKCRKRF